MFVLESKENTTEMTPGGRRCEHSMSPALLYLAAAVSSGGGCYE